MAFRRAVLLTPPSRSVHPALLPFYNFPAPRTPLESTLLQVFILKNLKSFRMNTYKKTGGRGLLWLTKNLSMRCLPEYSPLPASSHSPYYMAQITINYPLSPQSLTKCSSRNSFVLKMMHFDGGGVPPCVRRFLRLPPVALHKSPRLLTSLPSHFITSSSPPPPGGQPANCTP